MAKTKTTSTMATLPEVGFIRLDQVLQFIPIGRTSWHAGVKAGVLPAPVSLGGRAKGYRVNDILALIDRINEHGLPNFYGGNSEPAHA